MNRPARPARAYLPGLALLGLLLLGWLVYWPGRHGSFLFDDYSNLAPLGDYGPIHQWWKAVAFITSGFAGPTGRPLALASFLLDARNWPASPLPFKLTNVAVHLLCGAVLAGLLRALSRVLGAAPRRAAWVGVLGAGLWLLDPFWVSTTLYVVQRMAMLAALFGLAGLWGYVRGRELLAQGRTRTGYALISVSLGLGTLLATLSKENGALVPLLAWVLEACVLSRRLAAPPGWGFRAWKLLFLGLPAAVVLGYLLRWVPGLWSGYTGGRGFSSWQRLLSETRILWNYLGDIWLARAHDGGLFHDDVAVSTGWLHPWTTLPSAAGLLLLGLLAWRARRAKGPGWAAAGAAVVFFLTGHVLESTWLQLELVFEHRNYLPAALMFWPLAWLAVPEDAPGPRPPLCRPSRRWAAAAALALLALFALQTARRAAEWGAPFRQALVWAGEHPDSPRAQGYLANFWREAGNDTQARALLDAALRRHPHDLVLLINRAGVACDQGEAPAGLREDLLAAAAHAQLGNNVVQYQVGRLISGLSECAVFGPGFRVELVAAALRSQQAGLPQVRRELLRTQARLALARGDAPAAYALDLQALRIPGLPPGARLVAAAELGSAGHPSMALRLLDAVPSPLAHVAGWTMGALHARWLRHVGFYQDSEWHMRRVLQRQAAAQAGSAGPRGAGRRTLAPGAPPPRTAAGGRHDDE
ncbi:MAG: hypothetical protein KGS28_13140 [Betaproteobacteria bacterium]|nr:hypothetical protein [Betaproteobacteria bacterium]